jgi:hypothetical protein
MVLAHVKKIKYELVMDTIKKAIKLCNKRPDGPEVVRFIIWIGRNFKLRGWLSMINFVKRKRSMKYWNVENSRVILFLKKKINGKFEKQIAIKRTMTERRNEVWRNMYDDCLNKQIICWNYDLLKREEELRIKRRELRKKEMEQEIQFKKLEQEIRFTEMKKKKIMTAKIIKKNSQEDLDLLEKENLRITLKENINAENEKRKYFSKVLSSCIRKMEGNSTLSSFYPKPEQLMKISNRPRIVIVQNDPPSSREGKNELRKFQKKRGSKFTE